MMLMQGVIDSPDIPLNVSRSYLQADSQVKKISSYISRKVAEKLDKMFKDDRASFEEKWKDIEVFIKYGMLTDEKFYDAARKFFLLRDVNDKYYTLEEYRTLVEANQTDRDNTVIYLYSTDKTAQFSYIKGAEEKGYNVLLMDGQLDQHIIQMLESKIEKTHFLRVDSDTTERLIRKDEEFKSDLNPLETDLLTGMLQSQMPKMENTNFVVEYNALKADEAPATVTQNEMMRRMKEMAAMQPGMNFYGQMPDMFSLVVNTEQSAVRKIVKTAAEELGNSVTPLRQKIDELNAEITALRDKSKEHKEDADKEATDKSIADKEKELGDIRSQEENIVSEYAAKVPEIRQIIDLALLKANMLKGESLAAFIKRSVSLL